MCGFAWCAGSGCSSETQDFVIEGAVRCRCSQGPLPAHSLHLIGQTKNALDPAWLVSHVPASLTPPWTALTNDLVGTGNGRSDQTGIWFLEWVKRPRISFGDLSSYLSRPGLHVIVGSGNPAMHNREMVFSPQCNCAVS